ncbi:MAG TPA: isoprenylcysteine carboxylmethyltransferase family protein [Alphaproteobacteria bacterium]|nr:isoprenylcysteine carboxylmethyltransferase family protein [Alphaproteobacteria bacterium]
MAEPEKDIPHVVAPPPLLFLGWLAAGLALDWLWPLGRLSAGLWHYVIALPLVLAGLLIGLLGARQLRRARTEVSPYRPATTLVTGGIYGFSRNPLYLSLTLLFLGIAAAANGVWSLLFVLPCLLVIRYGVIAREEAYLERKFGQSYRAYKARVRRWL